jgi:hypothetical protein
MSEPARWRDDVSSPAEVRELLQTVKGAGGSYPLPAASRARSAARLDRMLALPAAAGILLWLKGVAVAAGIGGLGLVAAKALPALVSNAGTAAVTPVATAPAAARPVPKAAGLSSVPAVPVVPVPVPVPVTAMTTASAPAVASAPLLEAAPSSSGDSLAREAAMLDRARSLLDSDPRAALAVLDAQAAAFPAGDMGLERELLSLEALRRLHRVSEARSRGEALLQRAGGSIYEERVRTILDALPPQ